MINSFFSYFKTFSGFTITLLLLTLLWLAPLYIETGSILFDYEGIGFLIFWAIVGVTIMLRGILGFITKEYASYIATAFLIAGIYFLYFVY